MDLFKDFLPALFTKSKVFDNLNNYERGKFFFITNRFVSIKFPDKANNFNHLDIDTGQAVNVWHDIFQKVGGIPKWISDGIKKTGKVKSESKNEIDCSDELELKYCEIYSITYKEFERLKELYPKELKKEIAELKESFDPQIKRIK
jgi:hypothetical protein